jgi:16S rRNA (cytosine1402-N4)-methyltransferase
MQLDQELKGFSFLKEGPLDMRMNPLSELDAETIVNEWSERELGDIFWQYGEEPKWKTISNAIVQARRKCRICTTKQLSDLISSCRGRINGRLHPATLVFQALRICVNKELDVLQNALDQALKLLASHGKIGVISFHSLEDRIVKNIFREASTPIREGKEKLQPLMKLLTKKPIVPTLAEIRKNARARSAKMRFAEKN